MIYAHIFIDYKMWGKRRLSHPPRKGDVLRLNGSNECVKVTEVTWCLDEESELGQRMNINAVQIP